MPINPKNAENQAGKETETAKKKVTITPKQAIEAAKEIWIEKDMVAII